MKISQAKKAENREKIISTAVDLIIKNGLKSASMREIAQNAGIGEATIYNYFPSKNAIVFGYYQQCLEKSISRLQAIDGFEEFTIQEQLQSLLDTILEFYLPDREFVNLTFERVFFALSQNYKQLKPIRSLYIDMVNDIFRAAEEVGEIPEQMFGDIIYQLLWDAKIGLVIYWLKDESEGFVHTSVLTDKSLGLFCALLKAGVANKISDIALFLFKNHVLNRLDFFTEKADLFSKAKRAFMGGGNG